MSLMNLSDFEYAGKRKQTRREWLLAELDQVRVIPERPSDGRGAV